MKALWDSPLLLNGGERPQVLRSATLQAGDFWAMTGAEGGAAFGDGSGKLVFQVERFAARGAAITESGVVFLLRNALMAFDLKGERLWKVGLESGSVGRIFAGPSSDVVVLLSRRKRFVAERYDVKSGEYLETKAIDRRRGLLSRDGARLWTRDHKGLTCMDMVGPGITRVPLKGNGPMSERGGLAVTGVSHDEIVCVSGTEIRWRTTLKGRDLREAARVDGLEVDEDEFESAILGRPALNASNVFVPDANGVLHALDLRDGSLQWRFEGKHYPTMEQARRPVLWGDDVAFLCSDEYLYCVSDKGEERQMVELPGPAPVDPLSLGPHLLVYAEGLQVYVREAKS